MNPLFHVTRSVVKQLLVNATKFEWSLQGMGMLRLHLPDDVRLHVWDSRYRVRDVSMVHDHLQWGLESTIIAGELVNLRYVEAAADEFAYDYMFATLKPGYGCHFKTDPQLIRLRAAELSPEGYAIGDSYKQEPNDIHETDAADGTVTLMRKFPTNDESARVFWRKGTEWGSAEPRRATIDEVFTITRSALKQWF